MGKHRWRNIYKFFNRKDFDSSWKFEKKDDWLNIAIDKKSSVTKENRKQNKWIKRNIFVNKKCFDKIYEIVKFKREIEEYFKSSYFSWAGYFDLSEIADWIRRGRRFLFAGKRLILDLHYFKYNLKSIG